jgi:hypothetical protein
LLQDVFVRIQTPDKRLHTFVEFPIATGFIGVEVRLFFAPCRTAINSPVLGMHVTTITLTIALDMCNHSVTIKGTLNRMKNLTSIFLLALSLSLFLPVHARAVVFFNNTNISPVNTSYDGQDIVVSNCTVTVDGAHGFASLMVTANGVLAHSFSPNGVLTTSVNVTNEQQTLNGTTPVTLLNSNIVSTVLVTDFGQTVVYTNGVDYDETNLPGGVVELARTPASSIPDGATVLVDYTWQSVVGEGLNLTVTNGVTVDPGSSINVNATGYGGGLGQGHGMSSGFTFFDGSGGGDGGNGGMSASNAVGGICYDSLYEPTLMGSGGGASYAGSGGNGGGLIYIVAGGNVEIDGMISANGGNAVNSRAGGGSGGGIWIFAGSINGAGLITANGGSGAPGVGGGGGGGRIAIVCGTNTFSGTDTAYGGSGATYGGAGTIFTRLIGQTGLLFLNNGGHTGTNSTITLPILADVVVSGNAGLIPVSPFYSGNVTIGPNSLFTSMSSATVNLSLVNLTVQAGGVFSVNGLGSGNAQGGGNSYFFQGITYGGGGGHGGYGGAGAYSNAIGGHTYDNLGGPTQQGSVGGAANPATLGGTGGGVIVLNVSGTLDVDGALTANGNTGYGAAGGGGSGGSINLTAGTISGTGTIAANGGAGANSLGGGGGGGCIKISAGTANLFAGAVNCYGGVGANPGGAGTVYLQTGGGVPELLLDNGGHTGPSTPLLSVSGENLVIQNGASGMGGNSITLLNSLLVASNSLLTLYGGPSSGGFQISGNATILAGGGLIADSQGYPALQGTGVGGYSGTSPSYPGAGGGYGGTGGNAATNAALGGRAGYETITNPTFPGSGGGGYTPYSVGGSGGGDVLLTVNGALQLNGVISANGGNGLGIGGGGGSGGTIKLSASTFAGSGSLSANGGAGANSVGGGGGGGCIAISFYSSTFSGSMTASGGGGANYGGAGTIYLKTNTTGQASLILDNGGNKGAGTVIQSEGASANLTVRNGAAIVTSGASYTFENVLISSNASLALGNSSGSLTLSANNLALMAGCDFIANACNNYGTGPGQGLGSAPYYPGSGGGNGGYGGNAATNSVPGGVASFGTQNTPMNGGSPGGGYGQYSIGGYGGGAIVLNVSGMLQVNGTLSANGGNGVGTGGGGGSGGTLDLTIGNLSGSGIISANGGIGANSQGGGGGGGMIGINLTANFGSVTNSFNGTISAVGGGGANYGGAGTIFIRTNSYNASIMIVDNGGNVGTNTGIAYSSFQNGLILRNGAIGCLNSSLQDFSSLLITSNAWLVPGQNSGGTVGLSCQGNVTIQAGGGIIADTYGSAQNLGTGHGLGWGQSPFYPCSGAGHGGFGGFGTANLVAAGAAFDSTTSPNQGGSGGGGYSTISTGGSGGGYVNLAVQFAYVTTVNGIISANGGNGSGIGGGGGSGGSISISARTLNGTGSITANGGNGAANIGGGGGGGRIALLINGSPFSKTNIFGGTVTAYGGGGANYGGAGTVYYQTNLLNFSPMVVLDNNGHAGTNTSFDFNNYDVTVQNGAIGLLPSSGLWTVHNILIQSNSTMTVLPTTANITLQPISLTIAQGGAMSLDGAGYGFQSGPGAGGTTSSTYGGGGHGGYGGANLPGHGNAYDSVVLPATAGSGGASYQYSSGGSGGGALTISRSPASGSPVAVTVNGRLSANGTSSGLNAGGGSGGSINLNNISSLAGGGIISANGGAASGMGGGGGGGRIAISCTSNSFAGQYSASGGSGNYAGGAGTIYTAVSGVRTLLVSNGGIAGTNTPLGSGYGLPTAPFDLDISGAASVAALNSLPILSNLNLSAATTLTMGVAQSNLFIGVLNNANVGGNLNVDEVGYPLTNGFGAGSSINNDGSGGGYGGAGGASSSAAPGGVTYGSAAEPLAFGSGGGNGAATANGGSDGGGALRLSVLGTLSVPGNISANGNDGAQDNSGGGSGGSVWITAGALSGTGNISAVGGDGVLFGGGGGGGGRIAIYTPTNSFTGATNVNGGSGDVSGQPGTIFLGNGFADFEIISQSPTGQVMNTVSSVNLGFNDMVSAASVSPSNFTLITPEGTLGSSNLSVTVTGPFSVQVSFPIQNLDGNYTIEAATTISNMFGMPLAVPYSGTFSISLPTISGTVTDTNGAPVAGVMVQPNGGLTGMMTDANGNYSIGVPNGWNGTMTPAQGTFMFVPSSLSYTNVTGNLTNQNYLMVLTVAPSLTSSVNGTSFTLGWTGITGVTYQIFWSPDLVNWQPLGSPLPGTNGLMQVSVPSNTNSAAFFEIQAVH